MTAPDAALAELRSRIDTLNGIIVFALAERFRQTRQVGELKAAHGLPAHDPDREAREFARLEELAQDAGLDPAIVGDVFGLIVDRVKENHRKISGEQ